MELYDQEVTGKKPFGPPPEEDDHKGPAPEQKMPEGAPGGYRHVKPKGALGGPPCTDVGPLHNNASMTQTVQNTVPWPLPYRTLDDQNSYAPGHNDITKRYSALKSIVKDCVRL